MENINVIDLIKQMGYVIPSIIAAVCTLTALLKGIFTIEKPWVNHLVSWILSVACAEGFVALNGLTFGLGGWDYLVAGICGIIVGASANGIYDWEKIKSFFDAITNLFGYEKKIEERKAARAAE